MGGGAKGIRGGAPWQVRPNYLAQVAERFWARVDKGDGCWTWSGPLLKGGYGHTTLFNKSMGAHRAAWIIEHGVIPEDLVVCHHCDNPLCVRPSHLFLGTIVENNRDKTIKGHDLRGEQVGTAKLTAEAVREIRQADEAGQSHREIAKEYGVDRSTIWLVATRKYWRHIA